MNLCDMFPEGQREGTLAMVKQIARAEILEPYHTQWIAKDGRIVKVRLSATALVNEVGKMYAIATTEREIHGQNEEGASIPKEADRP